MIFELDFLFYSYFFMILFLVQPTLSYPDTDGNEEANLTGLQELTFPPDYLLASCRLSLLSVSILPQHWRSKETMKHIRKEIYLIKSSKVATDTLLEILSKFAETMKDKSAQNTLLTLVKINSIVMRNFLYLFNYYKALQAKPGLLQALNSVKKELVSILADPLSKRLLYALLNMRTDETEDHEEVESVIEEKLPDEEDSTLLQEDLTITNEIEDNETAPESEGLSPVGESEIKFEKDLDLEDLPTSTTEGQETHSPASSNDRTEHSDHEEERFLEASDSDIGGHDASIVDKNSINDSLILSEDTNSNASELSLQKDKGEEEIKFEESSSTTPSNDKEGSDIHMLQDLSIEQERQINEDVQKANSKQNPAASLIVNSDLDEIRADSENTSTTDLEVVTLKEEMLPQEEHIENLKEEEHTQKNTSASTNANKVNSATAIVEKDQLHEKKLKKNKYKKSGVSDTKISHNNLEIEDSASENNVDVEQINETKTVDVALDEQEKTVDLTENLDSHTLSSELGSNVDLEIITTEEKALYNDGELLNNDQSEEEKISNAKEKDSIETILEEDQPQKRNHQETNTSSDTPNNVETVEDKTEGEILDTIQQSNKVEQKGKQPNDAEMDTQSNNAEMDTGMSQDNKSYETIDASTQSSNTNNPSLHVDANLTSNLDLSKEVHTEDKFLNKETQTREDALVVKKDNNISIEEEKIADMEKKDLDTQSSIDKIDSNAADRDEDLKKGLKSSDEPSLNIDTIEDEYMNVDEGHTNVVTPEDNNNLEVKPNKKGKHIKSNLKLIKELQSGDKKTLNVDSMEDNSVKSSTDEEINNETTQIEKHIEVKFDNDKILEGGVLPFNTVNEISPKGKLEQLEENVPPGDDEIVSHIAGIEEEDAGRQSEKLDNSDSDHNISKIPSSNDGINDGGTIGEKAEMGEKIPESASQVESIGKSESKEEKLENEKKSDDTSNPLGDEFGNLEIGMSEEELDIDSEEEIPIAKNHGRTVDKKGTKPSKEINNYGHYDYDNDNDNDNDDDSGIEDDGLPSFEEEDDDIDSIEIENNIANLGLTMENENNVEAKNSKKVAIEDTDKQKDENNLIDGIEDVPTSEKRKHMPQKVEQMNKIEDNQTFKVLKVEPEPPKLNNNEENNKRESIKIENTDINPGLTMEKESNIEVNNFKDATIKDTNGKKKEDKLMHNIEDKNPTSGKEEHMPQKVEQIQIQEEQTQMLKVEPESSKSNTELENEESSKINLQNVDKENNNRESIEMKDNDINSGLLIEQENNVEVNSSKNIAIEGNNEKKNEDKVKHSIEDANSTLGEEEHVHETVNHMQIANGKKLKTSKVESEPLESNTELENEENSKIIPPNTDEENNNMESNNNVDPELMEVEENNIEVNICKNSAIKGTDGKENEEQLIHTIEDSNPTLDEGEPMHETVVEQMQIDDNRTLKTSKVKSEPSESNTKLKNEENSKISLPNVEKENNNRESIEIKDNDMNSGSIIEKENNVEVNSSKNIAIEGNSNKKYEDKVKHSIEDANSTLGEEEHVHETVDHMQIANDKKLKTSKVESKPSNNNVDPELIEVEENNIEVNSSKNAAIKGTDGKENKEELIHTIEDGNPTLEEGEPMHETVVEQMQIDDNRTLKTSKVKSEPLESNTELENEENSKISLPNTDEENNNMESINNVDPELMEVEEDNIEVHSSKNTAMEDTDGSKTEDKSIHNIKDGNPTLEKGEHMSQTVAQMQIEDNQSLKMSKVESEPSKSNTELKNEENSEMSLQSTEKTQNSMGIANPDLSKKDEDVVNNINTKNSIVDEQTGDNENIIQKSLDIEAEPKQMDEMPNLANSVDENNYGKSSQNVEKADYRKYMCGPPNEMVENLEPEKEIDQNQTSESLQTAHHVDTTLEGKHKSTKNFNEVPENNIPDSQVQSDGSNPIKTVESETDTVGGNTVVTDGGSPTSVTENNTSPQKERSIVKNFFGRFWN